MPALKDPPPSVWSGETPRQGYVMGDRGLRAVVKIDRRPWWKRIKTEERFGCLVAAGGVIWGVQVGTINLLVPATLMLTPGPLETCAIGILIWLHAKWRRSVRPE